MFKVIASIILIAAFAAIAKGTAAPPFTADDLNGKKVSLGDYKGKKNVLLVFSRYIGCSYCQMFMIDLMNNAKELAATDTETIIVVNSDRETTLRYEPPKEFPFTLIPDPKMELYDLYGVKMQKKKLTANVLKKSLLFLKYLPKYDWVKNGLAGDHYQPPACFVIDVNGTVVFSHLGKDMADNPDVGEILAVIKKLETSAR